MRKKLIVIVLISFEFLMIIYLLSFTFREGKILGRTVSINPIKSEDINIYSVGKLKYFYEPKANANIHRTEDFVEHTPTYTINDDSLNERFNYTVNKQKDTYRIVVLGDSYTYGLFVDTKDNYVEKLEDLLNEGSCTTGYKFEVINLGMEGYDFEYSVERYKKRGRKYNPDLVMWLVKSDDYNQIAELIYPLAMSYINDMRQNSSIKSTNMAENIRHPFRETQQYLKDSYGEVFIREYQKRVLSSFDFDYNGTLFLYTFPYMGKDFVDFVREYAANRNATYFYDQLVNYRSEKEAEFIDGHPNAYGYTMISKDLYKYMINHNIVPCYK